MPVVAAAVCPHPPLLIPEIAAGAAGETDDLRAACDAAVAELVGAGPDALVLVGGGSTTGVRHEPGSVSSFAGYGAPDVKVDISSPAPLSLLVGAWLMQRNGTDLPWHGITVAADAPADECRRLGRQIESTEERVALLVLGDGSARRSEHAPGHLHPRAEIFDFMVAVALETANTEVLAALDPYIATEVKAAGRAAWQVLAGAAADRAWRTDLLYDAAPYGLGYFVCTWLSARQST